MLEPLADDFENTIGIDGVGEHLAELLFRLQCIHLLETRPFLRLGIPDEGYELVSVYGVLVIIYPITLGVATFLGYEEGFNVGFETLFLGIVYTHAGTSFFPVTNS